MEKADHPIGYPPGFTMTVKDALEHLYDPVSLTNHDLAAWLVTPGEAEGGGRAYLLRQTILDAIDEMKPGAELRSTLRPERTRRILQLRYVEGLPFRDVMATLALSQTQYHREQRHAIESLSTLLWEKRVAPEDIDTSGSTPMLLEPLEEDLELACRGDTECVELRKLFADVITMLGALVGDQGIRVVIASNAPETRLLTNRPVLRELLINAIGYVSEMVRGGEIVLGCGAVAETIHITISYRGERSKNGFEESWRIDFGSKLAQSLSGEMILCSDTHSSQQIHLILPSAFKTLLIVDDNPGFIQLVSRYLADQPYLVISARSVTDCIELTHDNHPDVILLDVMLPHLDGWEALQLLKHDPGFCGVPIVVCTILGEAKLAYALGASGFIRKPVMRNALLEALSRITSEVPLLAEGYLEESASHRSSP